MRHDNYTQPSSLLDYWVSKNIITNAVTKKKKTKKNNKKDISKSENKNNETDTKDKDDNIFQLILNILSIFII